MCVLGHGRCQPLGANAIQSISASGLPGASESIVDDHCRSLLCAFRDRRASDSLAQTTMAFSGALTLTDLNDFITPSQASIKPVEQANANPAHDVAVAEVRCLLLLAHLLTNKLSDSDPG